MKTDKQTNKPKNKRRRKMEFFSFCFNVIICIILMNNTTTQQTPNEVRCDELIRPEKLLYERAIDIEINELKLNCYRMYREKIYF